jgi:hypothetical protein
MLGLEMMVLRNLAVAAAARATGIAATPIAPEVALATKHELMSLSALSLVWDDLLAKLRATDAALVALGPAA